VVKKSNIPYGKRLNHVYLLNITVKLYYTENGAMPYIL